MEARIKKTTIRELRISASESRCFLKRTASIYLEKGVFRPYQEVPEHHTYQPGQSDQGRKFRARQLPQ